MFNCQRLNGDPGLVFTLSTDADGSNPSLDIGLQQPDGEYKPGTFAVINLTEFVAKMLSGDPKTRAEFQGRMACPAR